MLRKQLRIFSALILLLFTAGSAMAVQLVSVLPRNADQLVARAQEFWSKMAAGQRASALQFVVPEQQNAFLTSAQGPIQEAKVLGIDLGKNSEHAALRIQITVLPLQSFSKQVFVVSSEWVWRKNNWYLDVADPKDLLKKFLGDGSDSDVPQMTEKEMNEAIVLTQGTLDIGTVSEGKTLNFDVGVRFTGRQAVNLSTDQPAAFIRSLTGGDGITSKTDKFQLIIDTTDRAGEINIPVRLRFFSGPISVERVLTVKGNVYSPITFRMGSTAPVRSGIPYSVFIRNHTAQRLEVQYFQIFGDGEVVEKPEYLEPNQETEIQLRPSSDSLPDRIVLLLRDLADGRNQFTYRFHHGS